MSKVIFLDFKSIIKIHDQQILLFGGSYGVRDKGLLESAIAMPLGTFDGEYLHGTIFEMAAAYLFHICKNHPFVDGNKRTSYVAMETFLIINDYLLDSNTDDLENLVLDTATGKLTKNNIAEFLRKKSQEK